MKKAFAALVILSMLLSAVAVAEAANVTGTWYLTSIEADGLTLSPSDFGMSMAMELKDDGTVVATSSDEEEPSEGTWKMEGDKVTVDINDSPAEFTLADGILTAEQDGMTMVFSQEEPVVEEFVPAAPVEAALEDFAGTWKADKIGMEGQFYPASMLTQAMGGDDVTATFEGTTITLNGFLFSGQQLPLELADGKLVFTGTDDESGMAMGITAALLEDGMLELNLDAGDQGAFSFYMSRAEAAEEAPAA